MIRLGLPTPLMLRLRLRTQIAMNRVLRQARRFRDWLYDAASLPRTVTSRTPFLFRRFVKASSPPTVDLLPELEAHFQHLIDLLCWAAKDGVHTDRDTRYAEVRAWFLQHYEQIRLEILPFLEQEAEDTQPLEMGEPAPRDAIESLFLPSRIDSNIHSRTIIARIYRARRAIDRYREHLYTRSLKSRT